jgi:hypothetical protein
VLPVSLSFEHKVGFVRGLEPTPPPSTPKVGSYLLAHYTLYRKNNGTLKTGDGPFGFRLRYSSFLLPSNRDFDENVVFSLMTSLKTPFVYILLTVDTGNKSPIASFPYP